MNYVTLTPAIVVALHDSALNAGELPGLAGDKSLDGALARVDNRLAYGLVDDIFDLAAAYVAAVSQGHCFNDGNKRTAFRAMNAVLELNGIKINWPTEEIGNLIIALAQRQIDHGHLADWLRTLPLTPGSAMVGPNQKQAGSDGGRSPFRAGRL